MKCPFKVGDQIANLYKFHNVATVLEVTDKSFKYKLNKKEIQGSPIFGYSDQGEVSELGFQSWELLK